LASAAACTSQRDELRRAKVTRLLSVAWRRIAALKERQVFFEDCRAALKEFFERKSSSFTSASGVGLWR
jgi:hypothetical protein